MQKKTQQQQMNKMRIVESIYSTIYEIQSICDDEQK